MNFAALEARRRSELLHQLPLGAHRVALDRRPVLRLAPGQKAAAKVLSATWQRCRVHFMRNALAHVGTKQRAMVAAAIRTAFTQEKQEAARAEWRAVADRLRERFPKLGLDG